MPCFNTSWVMIFSCFILLGETLNLYSLIYSLMSFSLVPVPFLEVNFLFGGGGGGVSLQYCKRNYSFYYLLTIIKFLLF